MAKKEENKENPEKEMSNEEKIGFHKGSLSTLLKERDEFVRLITIVEQLIQLHSEALKKLGVDSKAAEESTEKKRKLDEIL